ncbi:MAG TPA: archaemetzincin family Zn-dependent metalloprotease [Methanoregulaceae archaeon]|nr:archaemetzincin family Zn-dependent metalloprotease [Methanoregulaceae archaeon]
MDVLIFWDRRAPSGLARPVLRCISGITGFSADISENPVIISGYVRHRDQVNACTVLDDLATFGQLHNIKPPVLLVLGHDIFAPGLDFVFGLARPPSHVSVVSSARLDNEYYGRDKNDEDLIDRISKEGSHEIGHLFGLAHCSDHECIMYNPHTLDELDGKKKEFCSSCSKALFKGKQAVDFRNDFG